MFSTSLKMKVGFQFAMWLLIFFQVILLVQCNQSTIADYTDHMTSEEIKTTSIPRVTHGKDGKKSKTQDGWSEWSSWSGCSRSCNGGVSYQLRKCEKKAVCDGEAAKYRICNMQPCPVSEDFRATQCTAYNSVPYRGRLYEWLPYQDPEDPCSLTCHAKDYGFIAKLAPAVRDGTRCREGSLDMCVDGKCLPVGCDLQLGSTKKVDECGTCGGDGSSCRQPVYEWTKTPFSPCSVSCGGGYQMSRPSCINKVTGKEVDERLCNVSRPRPQIKECNAFICPPVWVTDSWSPCSASCGGGRQSRQVHCAQMGSEGIRTPVSSHQCLKQKPLTERPCNLMPCPQWIIGPWSGCSVTCGKGQKSRSVACQDAKGQHSEDCDVEAMPAIRQECDSELICPSSEDPGTYLFSEIYHGSWSQKDAPPSQTWAQKLMGKSSSSTEPSYSVGEWSLCSVTCGKGIRKRKVLCQIYLEFSKTNAPLRDENCPGPRPVDEEGCFLRPCALDQNKSISSKPGQVGIEVTYTWRMGGFTHCSASCLGGTKESVIQCVRDHDQAIVTTGHCDIKKKPESITQTCNDHPCPPRWNVTEYSPCNKSCGIGMQVREVHCLHEVTRGAANTLIVDNSFCPPQPPRDSQICNVFDCPSQWKTEAWSKCSRSCGGGEKTRKIRCMRELAFGQVVELAPSSCPKRRPKVHKPCNDKPCPRPDSSGDSDIVPSRQTYVQEHPRQRVFLKVGGRAIVFAGTNLKIRCPSRKSNKTNILWYKDDNKITSSRRVKVSMKGALRIRKISYKDSGKYSCFFGNSKADLLITVKPLPPSHAGSYDEKSGERPLYKETRFKGKTDEESHENQRKDKDDNRSHFSNQPKHNKGKEQGGDKSNDVLRGSDGNNLHNYSEENKPFDREMPAKGNPVINIHNIDTSSERVPLYVLAGLSNSPKYNVSGKPPTPVHDNTDSLELTQWSRDRDKNRYNTYTNQKSSSHDSSVHVSPPKVVDSWKQTYDGTAQKSYGGYSKPYWEKNHGGDLFSDQESHGNTDVGTPHGGNGFPGMDTHHPPSSGASSNHGGSHIQKLLVNLHNTLGGYRGRTASVHDEEYRAEADADEMGITNPSSLVSNSFILGKGKEAENLGFEWVITDWSPCSQSCGGTGGFQVRASQCLVKLNNVTKTVDGNLCEDAGLVPPVTVQSCGTGDCPHWETAPWSPCLEAHCFTWHSSYQKREIFCRTSNGTEVPLSHCDEKTRPRRKRECYNERCRSMWKVGEWSECTAPCSRQGFQSRILQCVWFGSSKPAGNACRDQSRPSVMRPCTGQPCSTKDDCIDRSNYCSLAKTLNLCHLNHYRVQCCVSCREKKA